MEEYHLRSLQNYNKVKMVEFTSDFLKSAFTGKITPNTDAVRFYKDLKLHADGEYPEELIDERRPSESSMIKEYRKKIFVPITEIPFNKVITSLSKIRKSPDYNVRYDMDILPPAIKLGETPKDYFEKNFPVYKSLTNWGFTIGLKNYLIDSNAIVLVMPNNFNIDETTYLTPVPIVFNSDRVIDYVDGVYAVLKSEEVSTYTYDSKSYYDGQVFYVVDDTNIYRWEQSDPAKGMKLIYTYEHFQGFMPAFKMKGNYFSNEMNKVIYKPKVYPMIHRLKEAIREYSDLQAEVVQHIHSEKWQYITQVCNTCNGTGKLNDGKLSNCTNSNCRDGRVVNNPYETHIITPPNSLEGQSTAPTPPAGYIQKQVEIVGIQDKRVQDHIYFALSAINMEFLSETPLNQSGVAKEVDKDELNNFVHSVAEDIISLMDEIVISCMKYRYGKLITDDKVLMAISPIIAVPERFDLLNTGYLLSEIKSAKESGLSSFTLDALQIDYANKKFSHDKDIAKKLEAIITLDPLSGKTSDEKLTELQNNGISELDYVISSNIQLFIDTALIKDKTFLELPIQKRIDEIKRMGEEKMKEIKPLEGIMNAVDNSAL